VTAAERSQASDTGLGRIHGGSVTVTCAGRTIEADEILVATGRRPLLTGIGLETIGLEPDAVLGGMAHGVESKIAAIQRQTTDRTDRLGLATDAQKLLLDTRRQQLELAGAAKAEALKAQVDYANLQKQLAEATTKAEIDALTEAARVAATKREAMLVLAARQAQAAESQLAHTRALVEAARSGATQAGVKTIDISVRIPDGVNTFTRAGVARITTEAVKAATGADYVNARI